MNWSVLGTKGVWTYDRATKTTFKMHVWYHYSLHDFLAYGIFCAWCVHGKFPCPTCKADVMFTWLAKGGKFSSFDKHRQFLPENHEFRLDVKHFTKGVQVTGPIPQVKSPAAVLADIQALEPEETGGFKGYARDHMWTHISGLTRRHASLLPPMGVPKRREACGVEPCAFGVAARQSASPKRQRLQL